MTAIRIVADLGNSRLKWGVVEPAGGLEVVALPLDDPSAWSAAWRRLNPSGAPSIWAVSTVNPPVAETLADFLANLPGASTRWYRSAADVPLRHQLESPKTAGADRALAVLAAVAAHRGAGPGIVVSCGSAITVERISAEGVWMGGAIAPGVRLIADALHALSTQLPLVSPRAVPRPWGCSTIPALEAGVFWTAVGSIRALVAEQSTGVSPEPWIVWTGGDADRLLEPTALHLAEVRHVPSLVLDGLRLASGV